MSNLHPVTIVDKNGRTTTVHRRDSTRSSVNASPPAPKLTPEKGAQGTPLPPLVSNTASQNNRIRSEFSKLPEHFGIRDEFIFHELKASDKIIVRQMIEDPDADNETVKRIISHGLWSEPRVKGEITASLLVYQKMVANGDAGILHEKHLALGVLYESVLGLSQRHNRAYVEDVDPIKTEEELAGKTAVITFIMNAWNDLPTETLVYRTGNKQGDQKWKLGFKVVTNKHLHDLIMERPEDRRRITEYVRLRDMHPTEKGPVLALRQFLDKELNPLAVSSGWL